MLPDLERKLKTTRHKYCTPAMQKKFVREKEESSWEDGGQFDAILRNDDFDMFWHPSFYTEPAEENTVIVGFSNTRLKVEVEQCDGKYRIADVTQ